MSTHYRNLAAIFLTVCLICANGTAAAEDDSQKSLVKRAEKMAGYMQKADEMFGAGNFSRARTYAEKALAVDKDYKSAQVLLERINQAEEPQKGEKRDKQKEQMEKKKSVLRAMREARANREKEYVKKRVEKYMTRARKYFSKGNLSSARRYAYLAKKKDPANDEIIGFIAEIDKEETFVLRKGQEEQRGQDIKKNLDKYARKDDPYRKYDEKKNWWGFISGMFTPAKYAIGEVQTGLVYTIDQCVQMALARNQRMVSAEKQIKVAEMRVWEARRDLWPDVTGKIERSFGAIGARAQANQARHYKGEKYQVEIKHDIFDGMGSWYKLRQSQTNLEIVRLEKKKVENEVIEETKRAYYNLDKSIKALSIQENYKENTTRMHEIVDKSYAEELVSKVEYLKVKGQNLQAEFQYISADEDRDLAELVLFQAMNLEPEENIRIESVERPVEKLSIGLENCYNLAFTNQPELRIKEETIKYYDSERKMAKSKAWPKIEFQGSFGKAYENYEPLDEPNDEQTTAATPADPHRAGRTLAPEWYAGVKGSIPIWGSTFETNYVREKWAPTVSSFRGTESATTYFTLKFLDNLAYFSNLYEAGAGFENAKYEYLKAKEDLAMEVKERYFKYRKALLQIDAQEAKVEHQRLFVNVLEERYKFGEMEASRVIEEYEKLASEEYGLVHGDASYFISLAELNKTIGVPDYFRPSYENREYNKWRKK